MGGKDAIYPGVTGAEGQPVRRHHRGRGHNSQIRHEQTPITYHQAPDAPGASNLQPPPPRKHPLTNKPGTRNGDDASAPSPPRPPAQTLRGATIGIRGTRLPAADEPQTRSTVGTPPQIQRNDQPRRPR